MKEAAEGLNAALMNLIDELDDNPTPMVGSPADRRDEGGQGEVITDNTAGKQPQEGGDK